MTVSGTATLPRLKLMLTGRPWAHLPLNRNSPLPGDEQLGVSDGRNGMLNVCVVEEISGPTVLAGPTEYMLRVMGSEKVAPGVVRQSLVVCAQWPLWQAQLSIVTVAPVRTRCEVARLTSLPNSEVDVASKASLTIGTSGFVVES